MVRFINRISRIGYILIEVCLFDYTDFLERKSSVIHIAQKYAYIRTHLSAEAGRTSELPRTYTPYSDNRIKICDPKKSQECFHNLSVQKMRHSLRLLSNFIVVLSCDFNASMINIVWEIG